MFWTKWIINLILACLVAFFGTKIYRVWSEPSGPTAEITRVASKKRVQSRPRRVVRKSKVKPSSLYQVVVEKNLFSPERKGPEPEPETEKPDEAKKKEKPPRSIVLYGVVLAGNYCKALLTNPDRRKDKRRFVWVSIGDSLGDYKLVDIQSEKVVLEKSGQHYEVSLYVGKKRHSPQRKKKIKSAQPLLRVTNKKNKKKVPPKIISKAKRRIPKKGASGLINMPFGNIRRK